MSRVIGLLALATMLLLAPGAAAAQTAPHCAPGQTPRFQLGFAALAAELGEVMGQPLECEHVDPASGDTVQKTSSGLAVYRAAKNMPTFTLDNGSSHWALTAKGLVHWLGESAEPPQSPVQELPKDRNGSAQCGRYSLAWSSPGFDGALPADARLTVTGAGGAPVFEMTEHVDYAGYGIFGLWCGDVLGDGSTALAYETYSGGAHCCIAATVVQLGQPTRTLLTADLGNAGGLTPEQLDSGGPLELTTSSDVLAYFDELPYASSAFLPLAFDYDGERYVEATRRYGGLMRADVEQAQRRLDEAVSRGASFEELASLKARVPGTVAAWLDAHRDAAMEAINQRYAAAPQAREAFAGG
jgi:hypothetical protein